MNLPRIFAARKRRPNPRQTYRPETLEGRDLLSTVAARPAAEVKPETHLVPMTGGGEGVASLAEVQQTGLVSCTGTGTIAHLGRVTTSGAHYITYTNGVDPLDGDTIPAGELTITAANGDTLTLAYTGAGTLASTPAQLQQGVVRFNDTLHYTIVGGTGRFAGAAGGGDIHAVDGTPTAAQQGAGLVPYSFDLRGVISSVGSDHKGAGA